MVLVIGAAAVSLVVLCVFAARRTMRRRNAAPVRGQERPSRQSAELARLNAGLDRETQLRGSEGRLRAVLDAALDAVIGMDVDDVITYWNPRAEAIFGWRPAQGLRRRPPGPGIPRRYPEGPSRGLGRVPSTGEG